jgi:hypothetical protein
MVINAQVLGMVMRRIMIFLSLIGFAIIAYFAVSAEAVTGVFQVVLSPTSVRVIIPSSTAPPTFGAPPTEIQPTFTPTNEGPPQLEAREEAGVVNIRLEADPEADIVGSIRAGERFVVTGRFFRWLQLRFESSPTGVGYVYDELVEIIGDESRIPDLTQANFPTQDTSVQDATSTFEAIQQTPGGVLTLTANARVIEAPSVENNSDPSLTTPSIDNSQPNVSGVVSVPQVLPTFTYPPNLITQAPTEASENVNNVVTQTGSNGNSDEDANLAPIIPVGALGLAGLLGLIISLRRH